MKPLDKRLDTIFPIWVKLKHTDDSGFGSCYTCGKPLHYDYMDCGHYPQIPREHTQFKWNTEIHKPQCITCNREKHGLKEPFRDRLVSELGNSVLSQMEFDSHKPYQEWTNWDKQALFQKLKKECQEMLREKMFSVILP